MRIIDLPISEAAPPSVPRADRAWGVLEELVREATVVHLSVIADDDDVIYSVSAVWGPGVTRPRCEVRRSLADAVEAIMGREEKLPCPSCKEVKAASLFSNNALLGGRNRYCKQCERKRLGERKKRVRAQKKAQQMGGWFVSGSGAFVISAS